MFDFFSEGCFNFVVSSQTFKINSILNTVCVFDFNLCAINTESSKNKTKIKATYFWQNRQNCTHRKKPQSRLISLLLILSKH